MHDVLVRIGNPFRGVRALVRVEGVDRGGLVGRPIGAGRPSAVGALQKALVVRRAQPADGMQLQDLPLAVFFYELVVVFSCDPEGGVPLGAGLGVEHAVRVRPEDVPLAPGAAPSRR